MILEYVEQQPEGVLSTMKTWKENSQHKFKGAKTKHIIQGERNAPMERERDKAGDHADPKHLE